MQTIEETLVGPEETRRLWEGSQSSSQLIAARRRSNQYTVASPRRSYWFAFGMSAAFGLGYLAVATAAMFY